MNDVVMILLKGQPSISINNESFDFPDLTVDIIKDDSLKNKDSINIIAWDKTRWFNSVSDGSINYLNGSCVKFDKSKYNDYVQPFVDLWNIKKEDVEKEEQEEQEKEEKAEAERNKFENRQARALVQLNADFETAKKRAHVKSSLGFEVDANQTANENVNGLLVTIGEGAVMFCDYNNEFHELSKSDLEILQLEIIQNAQNLYTQKWTFRNAIENCKDNEELDSTVADIEFTYMDFTPVSSEISGE